MRNEVVRGMILRQEKTLVKRTQEKNDTVRSRDMPGNRTGIRESVELSCRRKKKPRTTAQDLDKKI